MAFEKLKQRQSFVWGNGDFAQVADTIADVHEQVVAALVPAAGERWLDVACGTGGVTERAAVAGAMATGIDLASALVETAKRRAAAKGLDIDYRVGDCERLDGIEDASYDSVSSTFGVMFAPDHAAAAGELARVTRPGGRLGLSTWIPHGGIGAMFTMTAQFQPPLPDGAGAALDWGRQEHVEQLLGDAFDLSFETRTSTDTAESGEAFWRFYIENFGPVKTLAESLDDERREELHRAWVEFFETKYRSDGAIVYPREWLLVLGTRR
jgi:ubiquinone/menaquinone biosynthesis C-methylase UbiE